MADEQTLHTHYTMPSITAVQYKAPTLSNTNPSYADIPDNLYVPTRSFNNPGNILDLKITPSGNLSQFMVRVKEGLCPDDPADGTIWRGSSKNSSGTWVIWSDDSLFNTSANPFEIRLLLDNVVFSGGASGDTHGTWGISLFGKNSDGVWSVYQIFMTAEPSAFALTGNEDFLVPYM